MNSHVCNKTNQQLQCITIEVELCNYFIQPYIFSRETWGQSIRHLEVPNVQPHVLSNLKFHVPFCFINIFSYRLRAYSKTFLAWTYNHSCPFIFMVYLEWSFLSMGMARSIGFLASFLNTSSNRDIFIVVCIMEL